MFSPEVWGTEIRDVGYLHARGGAAQALLQLGDRERARLVAEAELADVKVFGAPRALGIALRVAGLACGGSKGIDLLGDSVASLRNSTAVLERAHSLAELGAALRRNGSRSARRHQLSKFFEGRKNQGANPLANDRSSARSLARTSQSDGGSNANDRPRSLRKRDSNVQRPRH